MVGWSAFSIAKRSSATCGCRRWSPPRAAAEARGLHGALLGRDEIEDERGPPEVTRAFSVARARVVELADAASVDHRDCPVDDVTRDIGAPMRTKSPVQIPVHVDPRGPAPGGLRAPAWIESPLAGGDARDRVWKPELFLVEKM